MSGFTFTVSWEDEALVLTTC